MVGEDIWPFTQQPFEERCNLPGIRAARELTKKQTRTGHVLEIGCADGVMVHDLQNVAYIGVDNHGPSIRAAQRRFPAHQFIEQDCRTLRFDDKRFSETDVVLMIDVIHMLSAAEALQLLKRMRFDLRRRHTLIVTSPVLSAFSIETWLGMFDVFRHLRRPPTGIFGRDIRLLATTRRYRSLLTKGGYQITDRFRLNHVVGVEGDWDWIAQEGRPRMHYLEQSARGPLTRPVVRQAVNRYLREQSKTRFLASH